MELHRIPLLATLELLLLALAVSSSDPCIQAPSACGHLRNISNPFRLATDPSSCGNSSYEIICDNNVPFIGNDSTKYRVNSINYHNSTIRLSDPFFIHNPIDDSIFCNVSSYPRKFIFSNLYYGYYSQPNSCGGELTYRNAVLVSCAKPLSGIFSFFRYEGSEICSNSVYGETLTSDKPFRYIIFDWVSENMLADTCRIEMQYPTSLSSSNWHRNYLSYNDIVHIIDYGFELTWIQPQPFDISYCCYSPNRIFKFALNVIAKTPFVSLFKKFNWRQQRDAMTCYADVNRFALKILARYISTIYAAHQLPLLCVVLPLLVALIVNKWRRKHFSIYDDIEDFLNRFDDLKPIRYSYSDIKRMTNNFRVKLGEGGFGSVYKGKLRSGSFVAIKILKTCKGDNYREFISEVSTIGRVRHVNIVRLLGFCVERSKRALVYEYMDKGSLEKYIQRENASDVSDRKMMEIAMGVARGIEYLHRGCVMQILHFDIKPHNVLLDRNFNPKISDFGLARLYPTDKSMVSCTVARGTLGYMAPEFFYPNIGGISHKVDVYSYGRMLMEMAARKRGSSAHSHSSQIFLPAWVHEQLDSGKDIDLGNVAEVDKEMMKNMLAVSLWCVQLNPIDRPPMKKIINLLQGEIRCIGLPSKPLFAPMREVSSRETSSYTLSTDELAYSSLELKIE